LEFYREQHGAVLRTETQNSVELNLGRLLVNAELGFHQVHDLAQGGPSQRSGQALHRRTASGGGRLAAAQVS
jgi:hypothetical protein